MKIYPMVLILASILTLTSLARAGGGTGTTTCDFLRMEQGARAVGAGGAFCAVADDAYATYWNPAGLSQLERRGLGVSHTVWFEDIKNTYLTYAHPIRTDLGMVIGSSLTWMGVDDIEKYDGAGRYKGRVKVSNYALSLAYAQRFVGIASFGLNIKGINQDLAGLKGSGLAADLGLLAKGEKFSFGLNLANIGPELSTEGKENRLPFNVKTGCAFRPGGGADGNSFVALDVDFPTGSDAIFHGGGESWLTDNLALRIGYNSQQGVSAGFGFRASGKDTLKDMLGQLDYAAIFPRNTNFDTIHRFSFTVEF